ncbi:MAG: ElyC/SanA/YdcF family protein [Cardiobacteriaceae bacterium]|nr:ElyC/SanA/YdcF family protein [Cardiobacteriaceae bacterium]
MLFILELMVGIVLCPLLIYLSISVSTAQWQYDSLESIPSRPVGLVLGTSKWVARGRINLYYRARIEAAAELYHAGKVCYLLVSGDNRRHDYNEPEEMRRDLVKLGVPSEKIVLDYAGLRTLDSILRAEKIFGQTDYVIISQRFHNARALWLAKQQGHQAIAYIAQDPAWRRYRLKTELREVLARSKALFDILTNKEAKHYGTPLPIPACPSIR